MWSVMENGNFIHMTTSTETTYSVPKSQDEWNKDESDRVLLKSKVKFILSCALRKEEHDIIE